MDKAIAKVNPNELDWYEFLFPTQLILYLKTTGYSLTAHSYLKSKFKMVFISAVITCWLRQGCLCFIKTIFQILRNDVIDNINKFNLATVFASIKCLNTKNRTSRILSGQVTFFRQLAPGQVAHFSISTPLEPTWPNGQMNRNLVGLRKHLWKVLL